MGCPGIDLSSLLLGGLANRVKRKDTLALKLERQKEKEQCPDQENIVWNNKDQWEALRSKIGSTLTRCVFVACIYGLRGCVYCLYNNV